MMVEPIVEALFIAAERGARMCRVEEVFAIAGAGLEGDRYAVGTGYYSGRYDCEITLIEAEVLDCIMAGGDLQILEGQHRRNVVTRGLQLRSLEGCTLRIGNVVLAYHRPRPPCDYLQRITRPGMTKALGLGAGIGMKVVEGGLLRQGMAIQVISGAGAGKRVLP